MPRIELDTMEIVLIQDVVNEARYDIDPEEELMYRHVMEKLQEALYRGQKTP